MRVARTRPQVFVDTHALLAAIDFDDPHHDAASALLNEFAQLGTPLLVSDWVLAEFLSIAARPSLRLAAIGAVKDLQEAAVQVTIQPATRKMWNEAFRLFSERKDKTWSLVDCTSIILCRKFDVSRVLTHDHHFTQAGLEILLP